MVGPVFLMGSENLLCRNIRGLNSRFHYEVDREVVRAEHISFACLQESKLNVISDYDVSSMSYPRFSVSM
jgi:hypothetical protein